MSERTESGTEGDEQRPVGPEQHPDGRDRRPHVQRRRLHGDNADAVEAAERPRQELAARLQGPRTARVPNQDRHREGRPTVQGEHLRHSDAQRCGSCRFIFTLFTSLSFLFIRHENSRARAAAMYILFYQL